MANPEDQAKILASYYKSGIIKLDREGVLGYSDGEVFTLPALNEYKHLALTGSGDSFMTGFIYGLEKNLSFKEVVLSGVITRAKLMNHTNSFEASINPEEMSSLLLRYKSLIS